MDINDFNEALVEHLFPVRGASVAGDITHLRHCVLCAQQSEYTGVLYLDEKQSKVFGAKKGKTRRILYGLCESCFALPDKMELVEQELFLQLNPTEGKIQ